MYEQIKNDLLVHLDGLEPEALLNDYTISAASKELAVAGRQRLIELAMTYAIVRKTEGLSKNTIKVMACTLKNFINAVNIQVEDIKANNIRAYLYRYQIDRNVSNRTLEHMRITICCFSNGFMLMVIFRLIHAKI